MPYFAAPLILCGTSTRGSDLPISLYCSGGLIAGSALSLILAASPATSPNRSVLPEGWCVMTPLLRWRIRSLGTLQRCAAAAIKRSRALAPTFCIASCDWRTVWLPTEAWLP